MVGCISIIILSPFKGTSMNEVAHISMKPINRYYLNKYKFLSLGHADSLILQHECDNSGSENFIIHHTL